MAKRPIRFGIIGLGLMGREFASAAARWAHLLDLDFQPVVAGICDTNPALFPWYQDNFASVRLATTDYHDLLSDAQIDAIYCAVPHNLHADVYIDIIRAGKHLLGEKPFGIDLAANQRIAAAAAAYPDVFIASSSEFPFFPGAQKLIQFVGAGRVGPIIEAEAFFLHSSDINPEKPINWKRIARINGEYGCMGDLGLHVLHVPLRLGWQPQNVRAVLSNLVRERPDGHGNRVECDTWDNAVWTCEAGTGGETFPITFKTYRIAPGETNTWVLSVTGMHGSARFSTRYPKSFWTMDYASGKPQLWSEESLGYTPPYTTITGAIFEFGLSDALLQMWAAFCDELTHGRVSMKGSFHCATLPETTDHHRVLTAALRSHQEKRVVPLAEVG
ncbi:MAG: Gfo/Idh/MocA family oxidoreductase [bacterium]|nr:Gfo/Idh/MocA family oxidoreductase [bacterium]